MRTICTLVILAFVLVVAGCRGDEETPVEACGDGLCNFGETIETCAEDCGVEARCPLISGNQSCDECILSSCVRQCQDCTSSEACMALLFCYMACADKSCEQECVYQYADGYVLMDAYIGPMGCVGLTCQAACLGICGDGVCGPGEDSDNCPTDCTVVSGCEFQVGLPSCDQCISEYCGTQCQACSANPDCTGYFNCLMNCSDAECFQQCGLDYEGGIADFNALGECMNTLCTSECNPDY